jgi:hypothetical protein
MGAAADRPYRDGTGLPAHFPSHPEAGGDGVGVPLFSGLWY